MTPNSLHQYSYHGNTINSFNRPLGRPASDLSMYYDKNFSFPPSQSHARKSTRNRWVPVAKGETHKKDEHFPVNRRSWPQIGGTKDGCQPESSQTNSTNYRHLVSSQLSSYTVSDQRHKVGIHIHEKGRPQTHDIAKLPSFKTQQKICQPSEKQRPSRPHSEQTMYKLPNVSKVTKSIHQPAVALQFASNGLSVRHSTYRSLANNPNLKVEAIQGRVKISRRRPKSLPSKFQEMHQLQSPTDKRVTLSGWQSRTRSPTFATLAQAKEHLDAALSRKLWEIRRNVDGQRARNNSAALSEFAPSSIPDSANPEEWYERMLREHSDEDLAAIETLCIANHDDDKMLNSSESISLEASKPTVDIRFDKSYLKAHINDWNILALMQDEEQKRAEKEKRESKLNSTRTSQMCQNKERKGQTTKVKTVSKTFEGPKTLEKKQTTTMTTPPLPRPEPVKKESVDTFTSELVVKELPKLEKIEDSQVYTTGNEEGVETANTEDLVAKYLSKRNSPKLEDNAKDDRVYDDDKAIQGDFKDGENSKDDPVEEKTLTEKEKFLLMRQRMEERKAEKQKTKAAAGFGDYVRLGMNVKKGAKNFLGALMSSRLEKMTTFQSRDNRDDEDSDTSEDYEEDETDEF